MKVIGYLFFIALIQFVCGGITPTTVLFRTPSLVNAIVKTERFGGSFAYSTVIFSPTIEYAGVPFWTAPVITPILSPVVPVQGGTNTPEVLPAKPSPSGLVPGAVVDDDSVIVESA